MSTPEMPSTSAWWVFAISAKRSPAMRWTSQISHSGLERSRRWENSRPASCFSAASSAGLRQRGVADVVARVEVRVVGPHRPALPERHVREALAVARHEVQAADDVVDELLRRRRLALEDHHRRDVHVRGRVVLQVQERRVERRQAVGVGHRLDCRGFGGARQCRGPGARDQVESQPAIWASTLFFAYSSIPRATHGYWPALTRSPTSPLGPWTSTIGDHAPDRVVIAEVGFEGVHLLGHFVHQLGPRIGAASPACGSFSSVATCPPWSKRRSWRVPRGEASVTTVTHSPRKDHLTC